MHKLPRWLVAAAFLFLVLCAQVAAQVAVPPFKSYVTDLAGVLTAPQRAALENKLKTIADGKRAQIAVLIVPTAQPEGPEQYSIRVAEQWKLGRKGVDNGVLLMIAMQERAIRIDVGYGLEGSLPDARVRRVIDDEMIPRFRKNDFVGGIDAGLDQIMRAAGTEPPPLGNVATQKRDQFTGEDVDKILDKYAIPAVLLLFFSGIVKALLGAFLGSGLIGAIAAGVAWWLGASMGVAAGVGVLAFFLSLFGISILGRGGGLGGGGISGGGGGFGGGGAGGRW